MHGGKGGEGEGRTEEDDREAEVDVVVAGHAHLICHDLQPRRSVRPGRPGCGRGVTGPHGAAPGAVGMRRAVGWYWGRGGNALHLSECRNGHSRGCRRESPLTRRRGLRLTLRMAAPMLRVPGTARRADGCPLQLRSGAIADSGGQLPINTGKKKTFSQSTAHDRRGQAADQCVHGRAAPVASVAPPD